LPLQTNFARVAVFVNEAVDRPRDVVAQDIGWVERECADAHLDGLNITEPRRRVRAEDADEPGRKAALRHQRHVGRRADVLDERRGRDILGQVEIVGFRLDRDACDAAVKKIGKRADDDITVG
jgi:hypothetical protein